MNYLGMHDKSGAFVVPPGGWCLDTVKLADNPVPPSYKTIRGDINWVVRLNWGYGTEFGTFPVPILVDNYIGRAITYVLSCDSSVWGFQLGNEPNHENERPQEMKLEPQYVAGICYKVWRHTKAKNPTVRVMLPAIAPYRDDPNWVDYMEDMYAEFLRLGGKIDGIPVHAYARGSAPGEITSDAKMDAPLVGQFRSFRTYRDALAIKSLRNEKAPALITEYDQYEAWEDRNTGQVREAVAELKNYNRNTHGPQVCALILYRWPKDQNDKWYIEGKNGVIEDFKMAAAEGEFKSADFDYILPSVKAPEPTPVSTPAILRRIEPDAANYGVKVQPYPTAGLKDGQEVWVAQYVERLKEAEAGGRHHFYFDTRDGVTESRLVGVPILVNWPTDHTTVFSEPKPGEPWSANYQFSTGKNAFSAIVADGLPSDLVTGAGMGEDTPSGFNAGIHSSIVVHWRKMRHVGVKAPVIPVTPTIPTSPIPSKVPALVHPVGDPRYQRITQGWKENPDYYKRFNVGGLPLQGHNGIDYGTPIDTPIVAVDAGTVIEVGNDPAGYGIYVKLVHSWGETLYAHLRATWVNLGNRVAQGYLIGNSGNSGVSTGPHLHFGLRVNPYSRQDGMGGYSNPLPYLSGEAKSSEPKPPTDSDIFDALESAAMESGLDWQLVYSLAWGESTFNPVADSGVAKGLLQISEDTWNEWAPQVGASNIWDAADNARVGAAYLKFLIDYYDGNVRKAIWGYNAGPGNVDKGNVPDITKVFADRILDRRDFLKAVASAWRPY